MPTHSSILLIDDSPGECELFRLALKQTGLDVALFTEQDAEAAFHFLEDRYHQSPIQYSSSETAGVVSTARVERGESSTARSASTETMPAVSHSLPSLILLDLHLRGEDGCELLKRLRSDARFAAIPIVIFTTSDDQQDVARCYAGGANGYVVKPGTFAELIQCSGDLCRFWLDRNRVPSMIGTPC
ncbi:MAG: response regulator [Nitrospira sp.]|jgi:CheY-like chemotaxis protein|nr:response regulator [Nitrospira sp.]